MPGGSPKLLKSDEKPQKWTFRDLYFSKIYSFADRRRTRRKLQLWEDDNKIRSIIIKKRKKSSKTLLPIEFSAELSIGGVFGAIGASFLRFLVD